MKLVDTSDLKSDFYKKVGFAMISEDGVTKLYELDLAKFKPRNIDYIKLFYDRTY